MWVGRQGVDPAQRALAERISRRDRHPTVMITDGTEARGGVDITSELRTFSTAQCCRVGLRQRAHHPALYHHTTGRCAGALDYRTDPLAAADRFL